MKKKNKYQKYYSWGYICGEDKMCYEGSHLDMFHKICTDFSIKKAIINDKAPEGHNIEVWKKEGDLWNACFDGDFIDIERGENYIKYIFD